MNERQAPYHRGAAPLNSVLVSHMSESLKFKYYSIAVSALYGLGGLKSDPYLARTYVELATSESDENDESDKKDRTPAHPYAHSLLAQCLWHGYGNDCVNLVEDRAQAMCLWNARRKMDPFAAVSWELRNPKLDILANYWPLAQLMTLVPQDNRATYTVGFAVMELAKLAKRQGGAVNTKNIPGLVTELMRFELKGIDIHPLFVKFHAAMLNLSQSRDFAEDCFILAASEGNVFAKEALAELRATTAAACSSETLVMPPEYTSKSALVCTTGQRRGRRREYPITSRL